MGLCKNAFLASISDEKIGGTYISLLKTVTKIGIFIHQLLLSQYYLYLMIELIQVKSTHLLSLFLLSTSSV